MAQKAKDRESKSIYSMVFSVEICYRQMYYYVAGVVSLTCAVGNPIDQYPPGTEQIAPE